jgi:hypothetical protein
MATAVEAYAVDHNKYAADVPLARRNNGVANTTADSYFPDRLSTPIAYISTARIQDPFVVQGQEGLTGVSDQLRSYYTTLFYQNVRTSIDAAANETVAEYEIPPADPTYNSIKAGGGWGARDWSTFYGGWKMGSLGPIQTYDGGFDAYDPTNGTVSEGDIYRTQINSEGGEV